MTPDDEFKAMWRAIDEHFARINRELERYITPERHEELQRESQQLTKKMLTLFRGRREAAQQSLLDAKRDAAAAGEQPSQQ